MRHQNKLSICANVCLILLFSFYSTFTYSQGKKKEEKITICYVGSKEKVVKRGKFILYNRDSTLNVTGWYDHYKKDSIWTFFANDTVIVAQGIYYKGHKSGIWKYYRLNGDLESTGEFSESKKNGHWIYYNEYGNISCKGDFDNGKEVLGSFKYFDNLGQELDTIKIMSHPSKVPIFRETKLITINRFPYLTRSLVGDKGLRGFIGLGINTPRQVMKNGVGGKAKVIVYIKPNGELEILKFMNSFSKAYADEVAIVLKNSHTWIPVTYEGKPINAIYVIPYSYNVFTY